MKFDERNLFRGIYGLEDDYDLIIVGAGLSGSVIAQQASERSGLSIHYKKLNDLRSLIIDKRDHIGGNCYDYIDRHGIRVSKYGAHIFHTNVERVWKFVNRFSDWIPYQHRVKANVTDVEGKIKIVPVPPNQDTVNELFGTSISSEEEMEAWINERKPNMDGILPTNGEEMSISRVGKDLYEKIFKDYTKKQWDKYPSELDASVLARLPFRLDRNDRYFNDPWEGLPKEGYTQLFKNMILKDPKITVRLDLDYFKVKESLPMHKLLIYTGPIDAYFEGVGMPKLEYRSVYFEKEYLEPEDGYFQPAWMVNYPGPDVSFTRIAEYKHMPNQPERALESKGTVIYREYSTDHGEPYYPVPNPENQELYRKYQKLSAEEKNVLFVGRLASYKYFNMDQAILAALELYDDLVKDKILTELKTEL